jgi:hypothetical protein
MTDNYGLIRSLDNHFGTDDGQVRRPSGKDNTRTKTIKELTDVVRAETKPVEASWTTIRKE